MRTEFIYVVGIVVISMICYYGFLLLARVDRLLAGKRWKAEQRAARRWG